MTDDRIVWRRRVTPDRQPPRHANPYFHKEKPARPSRAISVVSWLLLIAILGSGTAWLVWGDFFRLEQIIVEGNRFLATDAFLNVVATGTEKPVFKFLSGKNLLFISPERLEQEIQNTLGQHQALENLVVKKTFPSAITVTVTERVPNLVNVVGGIEYLIDREGVVVRQVAPDERLNPTFPRLLDQTTRTVVAGKQLVSREIVDFLFLIEKELRTRSNIPIDLYYLPPARCLEPQPPPEPELEEGSETTPGDEANRNKAVPATNRNRNTAGSSTNTNTAPPEPQKKPCDLEHEALLRRELRIRSTEDWEIYTRTDDSVSDQVSRLLRVLEEKHLDRAKLDYIDLRFGERVIIK